MSAETPTVSAFLEALTRTRHLPSTSNIPTNTCLYLPSASVHVNTTHSCLSVYRQDLHLRPLDSHSVCSHASHLLSRWRGWRDEKQTLWLSLWGEINQLYTGDLKVRSVQFWKTKVTFIQVVPDTLSQQRSQIEQHQDSVKNNAAACSYLPL